MLLRRTGFILLAVYLIFLGGSAYYHLIFPVRVIHHVLMTALLIWWIWRRVRQGKGLPATPLDWPLVAGIAVWFASALLSSDSRMALVNIWLQVVHLLLFYVLVDLMRHRERLVMETVFIISAATIMLCLVEIASWYFGLGILPGTRIGWNDVIGPDVPLPLVPIRLALAMNVSTLLAGFAAPLVTVAAIWSWTTQARANRIALIGLAAGLLGVVILTFSRGGLLSVLTAGGTLMAFWLGRSGAVTRRVSPRLIAGAAVFSGVILVSGYVIVSISGTSSRSFGDAGRLDMWASATRITRDHPVSGVGVGQFGRAFRDYRDPTIVQDKLASAHNAYLNIAAETGLPGVVVCLWLAVAFARTWLRAWRSAEGVRKRRLEGALAALLGLGAHSMVDVFTITPIVLVMLVLVAYVLAADPSETRKTTRGRLMAMGALVLVAVYGGWLILMDRAQGHYEASLRGGPEALSEARAAAELDPQLRLYRLQIAYLSGQDEQTDRAEAIRQYQEALRLEPTWETGWINLATLELRGGNVTGALDHLKQARLINAKSAAAVHWAELAEKLGAADDGEIVRAYQDGILGNGSLPLAAYWWATPLRQEAVRNILEEFGGEAQYRILAAHDPEAAAQMVPREPISASDWWITGESLMLRGDADGARRAFSEAIRLAPTVGDPYASRARAEMKDAPEAARRDLDLAELLGTAMEYPNAIRAELATTAEERYRRRVEALPTQSYPQEFAAVLYGRTSGFVTFPEMGRIGPGRAAMEPWYAIAEERLASGQIEEAMRVYRAILDYAPDEMEARERLGEGG